MVTHLRLVLSCLTSVICPFTLTAFIAGSCFGKNTQMWNASFRKPCCFEVYVCDLHCVIVRPECQKKDDLATKIETDLYPGYDFATNIIAKLGSGYNLSEKLHDTRNQIVAFRMTHPNIIKGYFCLQGQLCGLCLWF